ncbi:MAG: epoxide hydrolase N-terminal domain-containing protein, partial [Sphingomonadaceae bacterium]|nr:epoxide hydrolase N-terminal domain-containing protein [Sphingomonadaceae bacterium]
MGDSDAMTQINPAPVAFTDEALKQLNRKIDETRWIEKEPVEDWSQGPPISAMRALMSYWREGY